MAMALCTKDLFLFLDASSRKGIKQQLGKLVLFFLTQEILLLYL